MSKYGMLGLLEGIGEGAAMTGRMMAANSLAEAEDNRRLKLAMISRQWANEDRAADRVYAEDTYQNREIARLAEKGQDRVLAKEDKLEDRTYADVLEETRHTRNRGEALEDQKTSLENQMKVAKFGVDNREKSEYDKMASEAEKAYANGDLTEQEYKAIKFKLTKDPGALTAEKRANLRSKAMENAAKVLGEDMQFQALPAEKKQAALKSMANDLYKQSVNEESGAASGANIHPGEIKELAKTVVSGGYNPKTDRAEQEQKMQSSGIPAPLVNQTLDAADQLVKDNAGKTKKIDPGCQVNQTTCRMEETKPERRLGWKGRSEDNDTGLLQ